MADEQKNDNNSNNREPWMKIVVFKRLFEIETKGVPWYGIVVIITIILMFTLACVYLNNGV